MTSTQFFFAHTHLIGVIKVFNPKSCCRSVLVLLFPCVLLAHGYSPWNYRTAPGGGVGWRSRTLLESTTNGPTIDSHDKSFIVGYVLGWLSTVIYFFAIPSQIVKNVNSQSNRARN